MSLTYSDLIRFVYNIQLIYRKDIDKFLVNVFSIYEWTYLKALSNNDNILFKTYDK
ncbi:N-acetyltransferase [Priestia megaterium]